MGNPAEDFVKKEVVDAPDDMNEKKVRSLEERSEWSVTEYVPQKLKDHSNFNYVKFKSSFKSQMVPGDLNFRINSQAKSYLAIEEEEKRKFDETVDKRVSEILSRELEKSKEQGYKEGFDKGREEAYSKYEQETDELLAIVRKFAEDFQSCSKTVYEFNENYLIRTIFKICEHVLMREIEGDENYLKRLVTTLIEKVNTKENVKIYVSPRPMHEIEKIRQDVMDEVGKLTNFSVVEDERMDAGCRIETDFTEIDASLRRQLENLEKTMVTGSSGPEAPTED